MEKAGQHIAEQYKKTEELKKQLKQVEKELSELKLNSSNSSKPVWMERQARNVLAAANKPTVAATSQEGNPDIQGDIGHYNSFVRIR